MSGHINLYTHGGHTWLTSLTTCIRFWPSLHILGYWRWTLRPNLGAWLIGLGSRDLEAGPGVKSGHSGPKFARQSIHRILGPHPRPRRPCPPAVTPGAPIRPPKGRKTPPKSTVFLTTCPFVSDISHQPTHHLDSHSIHVFTLEINIFCWFYALYRLLFAFSF